MPFFQSIAAHKATTMGHIQRYHLSEFKIALSSKRLLDQASLSFDPIYLSIHSNEQQSRSLAAIRDALLPKLLSGEVRVNEAEETVGMAL